MEQLAGFGGQEQGALEPFCIGDADLQYRVLQKQAGKGLLRVGPFLYDPVNTGGKVEGPDGIGGAVVEGAKVLGKQGHPLKPIGFGDPALLGELGIQNQGLPRGRVIEG